MNYLRFSFPLIFLWILVAECTLVQSFTDPVTGILTRRSCISIDLPPITLTPERTAAERQLIGEDREIEENGWLIASAQSSRRYQRTGTDKSLGRVRRLYREQSVLEFFDEQVREYRNNELLGETASGRLAVVPGSIAGRRGKYRTGAELRKAEETARQVNRARLWIYNYYRVVESRKSSPDMNAVVQRYQRRYLADAPRGIWIRDAQQRWTRKR